MSLLLVDLDPKRIVSGNRRIHHHQRAQVCAYWRGLARDVALAGYGTAEEGMAWHDRIRITITVRFPDRRRRDVSNLYPFVAKPIVDGLVDARVVLDDDDLHVVGPDLRRDLERGPHLITIDIADLPTIGAAS
jgi:hypothetical protein